jgi:hypothetical protein
MGNSDVFSACNEVEQKDIEEGRSEGLRWSLYLCAVFNLQTLLLEFCCFSDGLASGILEGRGLGFQKGFEIGRLSKIACVSRLFRFFLTSATGSEVGFYLGCLHSWRMLLQRDPTCIQERAVKGLDALEEILDSIILLEPQVSLILCILITLLLYFHCLPSSKIDATRMKGFRICWIK